MHIFGAEYRSLRLAYDDRGDISSWKGSLRRASSGVGVSRSRPAILKLDRVGTTALIGSKTRASDNAVGLLQRKLCMELTFTLDWMSSNRCSMPPACIHSAGNLLRDSYV